MVALVQSPKAGCWSAGLDADSVELLCASMGLEELQALNNLIADAAASAADKQAAVQRQLAGVQVGSRQSLGETPLLPAGILCETVCYAPRYAFTREPCSSVEADG